MNKFRARTGLRTTASLVASLGLMTVLAMPALANHPDARGKRFGGNSDGA